MSDLASILGTENLDRLSAAAGGTRLYVPKHFGKPPNGGRDTSERLVKLVGPDLGLLLVFHFGDSVIYVPLPRQGGPVDRRKLKRLARRHNLTNKQIARRVGCSIRTVEKLRAAIRASSQTQGAQ